MPKRGKAQPAKTDTRRSVEANMDRLKGSSRSDIADDGMRQSASPLGYGSGSDKEKLKRSLTLRGRKGER